MSVLQILRIALYILNHVLETPIADKRLQLGVLCGLTEELSSEPRVSAKL